MQVTGDDETDSDDDKRAAIGRESRGRPQPSVQDVEFRRSAVQTSPAVDCLGFLRYCTACC